MITKTVHGILLKRAMFPSPSANVVEQYRGIIRGKEVLFRQVESPGRTYKSWEAYEWEPDGMIYINPEFARTLSSIVSLMIENIERQSMDRLKPRRGIRDALEDRQWIDEELSRPRMFE